MSAIVRLLALGTASGARYLMAGAVLGAIIALSLNMALSSAEPQRSGVPGPVGGGMPATNGETTSPYDVPVGTCLNWNESDGSDMTAVSCDEAHVFEVTEIIQVGAEFPEDAERPSVEAWRKIATQRCEGGVEDYLGNPLDPEGKFSITALLPNPQEWSTGQRTLRCGLWRIGPGGSLQATSGSAKQQSQADVWAEGTCLGIRDKSVGDPVSCEQPHSYELVALINLSKHFDKGYPPKEKQNARLDRVCSKRIQDYSGGIKLEKRGLIATWDTRSKASWEAGSVLVNCKVAKLRDDESGLAPISGSIAKNPPKAQSGSDGDGDGSGSEKEGSGSGDGEGLDSGQDSDDSPGGSSDDGAEDGDKPGNGADGAGENAPDNPSGN